MGQRTTVWLHRAAPALAILILAVLVWQGFSDDPFLHLFSRKPEAPEPAKHVETIEKTADEVVDDDILTYLQDPTEQARQALVTKLRAENPTAALRVIQRRVQRSQPDVQRKLIKLATRVGGRAAFVALRDIAEKPDTPSVLRVDVLGELPLIRHPDTVLMLSRWYDAPAFAEERKRVWDLAVAMGQERDVRKLEEAEPDAPAEVRNTMAKLRVAIESKLRSREAAKGMPDIKSVGELETILLGTGPEWKRLRSLTLLEKGDTKEAAATVGKAALRWKRGLPSSVQLNALGALIRMGEKHPTVLREILERPHDPTAARTLAQLVGRYGESAAKQLVTELRKQEKDPGRREWFRKMAGAITGRTE